MANCININNAQYKELLEQSKLNPLILKARISIFQDKNGLESYPKLEDIIQSNEVNMALKSVDILSSDKAKQVFAKGAKANWNLNKILTELQIPKEQKQVILDKYKDKVSEQEFIKSIFPDTKIKQIVYHATNKKFDSFKVGQYSSSIFFAPTKQEAWTQKGNIMVEAIINSNNPLIIKNDNYPTNNERDYDASITQYTKEYIQSLPEELLQGGEYFQEISVDNPEQIHILTEEEQAKLYNEDNLREEIITSLLADNSFVVEINTATIKKFDETKKTGNATLDRMTNRFNLTNQLTGQSQGTKEENTSYYSNLTVPGGTNYTENEIATPLITPSIKGHAQFATDNGIGWFRSDEQMLGGESTGEIPEHLRDIVDSKTEGGQTTKTRRILEVQSDLFQKGRDIKDLIKRNYKDEDYYQDVDFDEDGPSLVTILKKDAKPIENRNDKSSNQFLQLLNKDNNWVTFFIKSITQDSAKKGYEKVLFPSGNTASKVEGHTTLEEFKKQKEDRIKELEKDLIYREKTNVYDDPNDNIIHIQNLKNEISQLKKELERVEAEGFGALKPIYNFYENTVTNILNKTYGKDNVKVITDEYGNTWNEVIIEEKRYTSTIFMKQVDLNSLEGSKKNKLEWNETETNVSQEEQIDFRAENNRILFNNQQGKITVDQILENILNNFKDLSPKGIELLEKSRRLVGRTGAKIQFVSESVMVNKDTVMQIDSNTNTIQISRDRLAKYNTSDTVESFIHELAHAQTLQAILNPQTFEEKELNSLVREMFSKYKNLSNDSKSYGFEIVEEFVAEIYANRAFREELRALDKENNTSYWKQFISALRRLFGLAKTKETDNLIEQIIDFIQEGRRDYTGVSSQRLIFENKKIPKKTKIETIEDKLTRTLNKAKDNLDQLLKRSKTYKTSNTTKGEAFEIHIKELISKIESVEKLNEWKSIAIYVKSMVTTIKQLNNRLENDDLTKDNGLEIIELYKSYLSSYDLIDDVQDLITSLKKDKITEIGEDVVKEISDLIQEANGKHSFLESSLNNKLQDILKTQLNTLNFLPKVENFWRDKLRKEYNARKITNIDKESWVSKQMETIYKDEIQQDVDAALNDLLSGIGNDISSASVWFLDGVNNNSQLVSITMNLIEKARVKIIEQTTASDFKDKPLFEKLVKERGTSKPSELYKNILEYDSTGKAYYKGKYSLKFRDEFKKYQAIKELAYTEHGKESVQYKTAKVDYDNFIKKNTTTIDGQMTPIAKWKTNVDSLTQAEKDVLNHFITDTEATDTFTRGRSTLIENFKTVKYYNLPSVTKSNEERLIEGNLKGIGKDIKENLTSIRPDDVGYEERSLSGKGDPVNFLKVQYRGELRPDQQSLDLFTINRLNRINGINFKEKESIQLQVEAIKTVAKNKQYYLTQKGSNKPILNMNATREKYVSVKGIESNEYAMISNLIEKNLYDIFHINYGTIGPVDVNKLISTANGWVASVGLSLNMFSAAANVLNAQSQLFLEKMAGNHLTKGSVRQAHALYTKDLPNIASDYGKPVKESFVNQVNQMFDTFGGFNVKQQEFIKNSIAKTALNFESLQFMHAGGEHYVQSIMVMATLASIKTMNDNNDYIDKEGNVTTKDKAASILDMLSKNKDGMLELSDKVIYSDRNYNSKLKEGGKEQILLFVKKKLFDTMGNYDSNMQPEAYRHWWGKMFMLFRRYLIPQAYVRFRGITKAFVAEENLEEEDKHFSSALRTSEEGSYVSTLRFMVHGVYPALKRLKFDILSQNWNDLTDNQRANIKRTTAELALTAGILPLIGLLAAGAAGDDDDNKYLWTVAFLARRLESELGQFRDPREAWKITKSPIPSLRIIEQSIDVISTMAPWNWNEINDVYQTGKNKGDLKLVHNLKQMVPVISKFDTTAEELYNGLTSRVK